ncbi:MAG: efflux transporter outer membrane subunit [Candidatus Binatia bacterium]
MAGFTFFYLALRGSRVDGPVHFATVRNFTGLMLALSLAGCTVGPDYEPPPLPVPEQWSAAPADAHGDADLELSKWWGRFGDPQLTDLVARAARGNLDLRIAEARVIEARALRGIASSRLWPEIDAAGRASATAGAAAPGFGGQSSLFLAALEAFWEIDVFGGVRRSVEAAEADVDASLDTRRAVLLDLIGSVAVTYVEMRGLQGRIAAVRGNLAAQEETRELTEAQRNVGLASDLDVERARALVAATAAELPPLETALSANIHRLGVLLGEPPAALNSELSRPAPIPSAPREVVAGVPTDLLRRRPDLGRAERELAAATARIGEATADLYPRFTLTGSVGLRSEDVKDLLQGRYNFAAIGPNIIWPLFAAGRIMANIDAQNARQQQALARYEQTLLLALEDVETALVRYAREQIRRSALRAAVDANREAAVLARRLHANGLIEFLDVLVAERSLLESEDRLVTSETAVSSSLVTLYVALGGGWEAAEAVELGI